MTTNLIDLEARLTELRDDAKQIETDIEASTPLAPAATKAPRIMLAFLMGLSIGLSLGAAGVAIAISML